MTNAKTLARVYIYTYNFIEIKEGRNTFICNIKVTDYS